MATTVETFRSFFPEFDHVRFPDVTVQVYLTVGAQLVNEELFGNLFDFQVSNVTAHYLALGEQERKAAQRNAAPGSGGVGLMTSKGADSLSAGYDVNAGAEDGAGFWNLTRYGREYYRLVKLFGAAPIQIGLPSPWELCWSQAAWSGASLQQ